MSVVNARLRGAGIALAALVLASGCGGDDGSGHDDGGEGCLSEPLPLNCNPTFPPTFQAIYANMLSRTCGAPSTGGSCHGPDGMQAGLLLLGEDEAYAHLRGEVDGRARVVPGDPECSPLVQRLESDDPAFVMPVGMRLPLTDRCAVRQWIAGGAER